MNLDVYRSGSTEPWAVSTLLGLIYVTRPRDLLELGAFEGRTTLAIAEQIAGRAEITAIEHDADRVAEVMKRTHEYRDVVNVLQSDAIKFLKACNEGGVFFDFAFVDDDHTYAHVAEEVDLLKRIVRPGGLIVLHDVIGPFGLDQLVRHHGGRIIELPLLHAAGGLGLIRV